MTGLDCLREEMLKRGANKSMVESRTAAMVLDILSEGKAYATEQFELEQKAKAIDGERRQEMSRINNKRIEAYCMMQNAQSRIAEVEEKEQYINNFLEGLKECETPEARDAMRTAQVFVNSVDVSTKYDNTAFIIGLATILTNGKMNGVDELKKINRTFG